MWKLNRPRLIKYKTEVENQILETNDPINNTSTKQNMGVFLLPDKTWEYSSSQTKHGSIPPRQNMGVFLLPDKTWEYSSSQTKHGSIPLRQNMGVFLPDKIWEYSSSQTKQKIKWKTKTTTLSKQLKLIDDRSLFDLYFNKNYLLTLQTEAKSIPITHIYMTTDFTGLEQPPQ